MNRRAAKNTGITMITRIVRTTERASVPLLIADGSLVTTNKHVRGEQVLVQIDDPVELRFWRQVYVASLTRVADDGPDAAHWADAAVLRLRTRRKKRGQP